jgi:hypothetical protein
MNEEPIKFETALLAKQFGFTLKTVGSHVYNYYEDDGRDGYISWGHLHTNSPAKVPQSLLQKHLRDNHNIHVEVGFDVWNKETYTFEILIKGNKDYHYDDFVEYNTYEECLEQGLVYALNLINNKSQYLEN